MRVFVTVVVGREDVIESGQNKKKWDVVDKLLQSCNDLIGLNIEVQMRTTNMPPRKEDTRTY